MDPQGFEELAAHFSRHKVSEKSDRVRSRADVKKPLWINGGTAAVRKKKQSMPSSGL